MECRKQYLASLISKFNQARACPKLGQARCVLKIMQPSYNKGTNVQLSTSAYLAIPKNIISFIIMIIFALRFLLKIQSIDEMSIRQRPSQSI